VDRNIFLESIIIIDRKRMRMTKRMMMMRRKAMTFEKCLMVVFIFRIYFSLVEYVGFWAWWPLPFFQGF